MLHVGAGKRKGGLVIFQPKALRKESLPSEGPSYAPTTQEGRTDWAVSASGGADRETRIFFDFATFSVRLRAGFRVCMVGVVCRGSSQELEARSGRTADGAWVSG